MRNEREPLNNHSIPPETFARRLAKAAGRTADTTARVAMTAVVLALTFGPLLLQR